MSGHSKWNNIKHKKEKTDAQRAKVFTKTARRYRSPSARAEPIRYPTASCATLSRRQNPSTCLTTISTVSSKKQAAPTELSTRRSCTRLRPHPGVAVIVEAATDNRNRTGGDIRHFFDKYGGNLGQMGCVSYMFETKGVIIIVRDDDAEIDEDALMEVQRSESGRRRFLRR